MLDEIATTPRSDERFKQGCERFMAVTGFPAQAFLDNLKDSSPDFGRYLIEWVFGDVYGRDDLDLKTRELVVIAAGAALGATGIDVLKFHIPNAIRVGATREQVFGALIQVSIVAGIPIALAAITAAGQILSDVNGAVE
ncbi:carboxymuconolactone decarboxylase family protein [Ollibium composti]|uniref:Carboxymuconolactone decarboxylase family protein n=1 Tax=Ollibium composti TaxID=2675109 RepID=A0ABY2Q607_9HYPH|nr:carboxymuconolactone decarboxylase family protein [Mesorhizobium composti]THF56942.1 carboxymuconolactone decarboxylase family protein [Mesorhizobium composti]